MLTPRQLANAIRALAMDAVQKANSGHPGMPMGMADIAEVLWNHFLKHNPEDPHWPNRDRFVISNGHGAMLLYALLHLTGYPLSIEDLRQFRQLHSKTPGHPEYGYAPGTETTTGPLGQGLANAVGMALAEKTLAAQFNREDFNIIDHYTYAFVGDGCLMEGISHEVCSLAGTWELGKLIVIYDQNGISIDGEVNGWFTDNTPERFRAYHWHVIDSVDGHDPDSIKEAIRLAQTETAKPTLICCRTQIGFGAPTLAGTAKSHGAPLGEEEIVAARLALNWPYPPFEMPDAIYKGWDAREKGRKQQAEWTQQFSNYAQRHPELAAELKRRLNGELPDSLHEASDALIKTMLTFDKPEATRKLSEACIKSLAPKLPELIGGSADLTGSNCTIWPEAKTWETKHPDGNYLHYGVREFGMFAIMNGIALHGGFIPFGGTFLTFVDYGRNAVRLSAMMQQKVIFILTHDSIGLGEDGPTHQPIEHAAMLRLTPGLIVWRPADALETAVAWLEALSTSKPSCLLLSRQKVSPQTHDDKAVDLIKRGGYIIKDCHGTPDVILMATGSEVELIVQAYEELSANNIKVSAVSFPSTSLFDEQAQDYKDQVLPPEVKRRVAVEAAAQDYWYKYVGLDGKIVALNRYGESAPAKDVYKALGITSSAVVRAAKALLV